jgi:DNA-binding LacI/PurR family transcriptional regulator
MKKGAKSIGVREVAVLADVSFSTAAAALRGEAWVKAPTRLRVEQAAAQLGYRRDAAASILASRRTQGTTRSIAIAYVAAPFGGPTPGSFARRMPGLADLARERGLQFERIELRDPEHARQVHRRLVAIGVDGLILGPVDPERFFEAFAVEPFSLVGDSRGLVVQGVDTVRANHFTATQRLLGALAQRGYRRVGVVLRCHRDLHADDRARYGALVAARDLEPVFEHLEVLRWPFYRPERGRERQREEERRELERWQSQHRFEVLVGFGEEDAALIEEIWPEGGVARPDFAAMMVRPELRGRVAGVVSDQEVVERPILDRLVEKIRARQLGRSAAPVEIVIDLPFAEGASLRRK